MQIYAVYIWRVSQRGMRALATVSAISAEELKEMCAVCYWYTQPTLPAARTLYIYPDLS